MPIKIFTGRVTRYLAEKICESYGTELSNVSILEFKDGEFQPYFEDSVRGCIVFIIQSTFPPADNIMELLLMIDAAKRASALQIVAVMPYMGYTRQDRKDKPRCSIGAKLMADILAAAGANRIMTMDLHADQIQGFFNVPVDHLYASALFVPYINNLGIDNLVIAAPDMGGTKRANAYARFLQADLAICYKIRKKANVVDDIKVIGDIKDKNIIIIDDMIDTAETICIAAESMCNLGAKSVRVFATHPILSGLAYEKIESSLISEVIVTDTIPLKKQSKKIKVISVADLFAKIIDKVYKHEPISSTFLI